MKNAFANFSKRLDNPLLRHRHRQLCRAQPSRRDLWLRCNLLLGHFPCRAADSLPKNARKSSVILHETPVVAPRVVKVQEQQVQIEPRSDTKLPEEADATPVDSKTKAAYTSADIAKFLRSSTGQRNAIILREIFGPPRSLQPLDLVRSA